jgi:hypothetical protein
MGAVIPIPADEMPEAGFERRGGLKAQVAAPAKISTTVA